MLIQQLPTLSAWVFMTLGGVSDQESVPQQALTIMGAHVRYIPGAFGVDAGA